MAKELFVRQNETREDETTALWCTIFYCLLWPLKKKNNLWSQGMLKDLGKIVAIQEKKELTLICVVSIRLKTYFCFDPSEFQEENYRTIHLISEFNWRLVSSLIMKIIIWCCPFILFIYSSWLFFFFRLDLVLRCFSCISSQSQSFSSRGRTVWL